MRHEREWRAAERRPAVAAEEPRKLFLHPLSVGFQMASSCAIGFGHRIPARAVADTEGGTDRQKHDRGCRERPDWPVAHPPEDDDPAQRVGNEDVSVPDEIRVREANHQQPEHPAKPQRPRGAAAPLDLPAYSNTPAPKSIEKSPIIFRSKTTEVKT